MQIKMAWIIDMQMLFARMSPATGSSISMTERSWLNRFTIWPASVEVKNESGAF